MDWPRQIETARAQLRDPRPGDAESAFRHWASDPMVLRYLGIRPHDSPEDTRRQISYDIHRWLKGSAWVWNLVPTQVVGDARAQESVGLVELQPMTQPGALMHHLRLGYLCGQAVWGHGLVREAVSVLSELALQQPEVWRIDALCDVENERSSHLLEALGWRREGLHRRAMLHPNVSPEPRDVWVYALTR